MEISAETFIWFKTIATLAVNEAASITKHSQK
jgi:hypothetical protein